MPQLTIRRSNDCAVIEYHGEPILDTVLAKHGYSVAKPCGGRGTCGKCAIEVSGFVSQPNPTELSAGVRLACQVVLKGDAEVILPEQKNSLIQTDGISANIELMPMQGAYGAAVDIGTTTVVLKLYNLHTAECVAQASCLNPQQSTAADVMGRIDAAMKGSLYTLQQDISKAISALLEECCKKAGLPSSNQISSIVLAGNTTMLYLLCGRDPSSLSRAPFIADTLFGETTSLFSADTYLPPCMNAFVGADITCAVLASGMCNSNKPVLLCDIGTNGEIALWKNGKLYTTSTAAGPAFEGAGISCGCGSIIGAIDRVHAENGTIHVHTIGEAPAVGICGSGLIDAVAAFLELDTIDETGATEEDELMLSNGVALLPKDIRAVQLAKAAIAAGIETTLEVAETTFDEIETFYIAGGFGSHLNTESAASIGLIPKELADKVKIIGNASLSGAAQLLLHIPSIGIAQDIAAQSVHVNLGGNPRFNERYMDNMFFGDLF